MPETGLSQAKPKKDLDITKFFIPFARAVPQKRPSPASSNSSSLKRPTVSPLSTPRSASGARNVSPSTSPSSAVKSNAPIPYRSPRPKGPARLKLQADLSSSDDEPNNNGTHYQQSGAAKRRRTVSPAPQPVTASNMRDINLSAQNVVRDGKLVAVRDSDEDDTDSLQSLDDLIGSGNRTTTESRSTLEDMSVEQNETERRSLLNAFTRGRAEPLLGKKKLQELRTIDKSRKFDISEILSEQERAEEFRRNVEIAQAGFAATEAELERAAELELSKDKLQNMIGAGNADEEDINRLMHAMERTEALSSDKSYSFFGAASLRDRQEEEPEVASLPSHAMPEDLGDPKDEHELRRAYSTGFMAEMARMGRLCDEALMWTLGTISCDIDDDSRAEKIDCLRQGLATWTRTNVTALHVQNIFETLGASAESLRDNEQVEARHQPLRERPNTNLQSFIAVLELFYCICQDMDFATLSKLVSVICRLTSDVRTMADFRISASVERLLAKLLDLPDSGSQQHVSERLIRDMTNNLKDPMLQAQLLKHILPISTAAKELRVELASRFLLGETFEPSTHHDSVTIQLERLTKHVTESPDFDTTVHDRDQPINYAALTSITQLLDIAIADGGHPGIFPNKLEEQAFNASIDKLADAIKNTFATIADSGATHMRRAEAKEALQIVYWRLLYAVRTEPRTKKSMFDSAGNLLSAKEFKELERTKEFMARFVRKKQEAALADERKVERLSSDPSQISESEALIRAQLGFT